MLRYRTNSGRNDSCAYIRIWVLKALEGFMGRLSNRDLAVLALGYFIGLMLYVGGVSLWYMFH